MKERPIIFSGPSVLAIQQDRKTQTRRVVKPVRGFEQHNICEPHMAADPWAVWWHCTETDRVGCLQECPYGVPGDRLWVREGWSTSALGVYPCPQVWYRADFDQFSDPAKNREHTCPKEYQDKHSYNFGRYADCFACDAERTSRFWWHSSIHMPRKFSRLLLEIIETRVQRVQEINYSDVIAEGLRQFLTDEQQTDAAHKAEAKQAYAKLWDSINAKRYPKTSHNLKKLDATLEHERKRGIYSWQSNPYVWVISFKRITKAPLCLLNAKPAPLAAS